MIDDCIHNLSVQAAERRIRLNADIAPTLPLLQADGLLLRQAVGNLLGNAIKYSPPDTEIPAGRSLLFICRFRCKGSDGTYRSHRTYETYKSQKEKVCIPVTLENGPASGSIFTLYLPLSV